MKKFLSIALALLMVCVMLPVVAMADESVTTAEALKTAVENGGEVFMWNWAVPLLLRVPARWIIYLMLVQRFLIMVQPL